jgi:hypothetical protein
MSKNQSEKNLKSVSDLVSFLVGDENQCIDLWDDLRFDSFYTGNFEDPAYNWGGIGFIPLSGYSNGDITALYAIPGKKSSGCN